MISTINLYDIYTAIVGILLMIGGIIWLGFALVSWLNGLRKDLFNNDKE